MNSLFIGLLVAGVVLVIGVIAYNWLQERRARRRLGAACGVPGGRGGERAEPGLRGGDSDSVPPSSVAIESAAEELSAMPVEGKRRTCLCHGRCLQRTPRATPLRPTRISS